MLEANAAHLAPALATHQLGTSAPSPPPRIYRAGPEDDWLAVDADLDTDRQKWLAAQPRATEAAAQFQSEGIAAAPALGAEDLLFDEHMRERDLVVEIPHNTLGIVPVHGCAIRSLMSVRGGAPDLGEHTAEILAGLGLSEAEISAVRS
jgi:crotonobetainyl-CoA:carnitine CoA-transferase CaiB-like acyl-CoA transferase